MVDWNESGTLRRHFDDGDSYVIRTDPLDVLVICALQGHEGDVNEMTITMASGTTYSPGEILDLARRADRPRWPQ